MFSLSNTDRAKNKSARRGNFERVDGYLFTDKDESDDDLAKELEAAKRAGIPGVELLGHIPQSAFQSGPCLRFPRQAQFHPLRYLNALASAITERGGSIYAATHAKGFSPAGNAENTSRVEITTANRFKITAEAAVIATNTPVNDWVVMHTKQAAYRTYVIAVEIGSTRELAAPGGASGIVASDEGVSSRRGAKRARTKRRDSGKSQNQRSVASNDVPSRPRARRSEAKPVAPAAPPRGLLQWITRISATMPVGVGVRDDY